MTSCNNSQFTEGISMHCFPKNPVAAKHWIAFVRRHRPNWKASASSHLCSAHFEANAFTTNVAISDALAMKRKLLPNAIPTIDTAAGLRQLSHHQQTERERRKVSLRTAVGLTYTHRSRISEDLSGCLFSLQRLFARVYRLSCIRLRTKTRTMRCYKQHRRLLRRSSRHLSTPSW